MTITLDLPAELEARLAEEADGENLTKEQLASQLLALALAPPEFKDGAEMVEYWKQIGLVGMWADREEMRDSTAWVRRLRDGGSERSRGKMGAPK